MNKKLIYYLQIGVVIAFLFGAIWLWVTSNMKSDGKELHRTYDKIIANLPSLKVEYHEKNGYFPCLTGSIEGVNVHVHHEYKSRSTNQGHFFITFWGKTELVNKARWFNLATKHNTVADNYAERNRKFSEERFNKKFIIKDKDADFALRVFDNATMETLLKLLEEKPIEIFLDEGNLKFMRLSYFTSKNEADLRQFSELLTMGAKLYNKALAVDAE